MNWTNYFRYIRQRNLKIVNKEMSKHTKNRVVVLLNN